jgi:hypothetical protein
VGSSTQARCRSCRQRRCCSSSAGCHPRNTSRRRRSRGALGIVRRRVQRADAVVVVLDLSRRGTERLFFQLRHYVTPLCVSGH